MMIKANVFLLLLVLLPLPSFAEMKESCWHKVDSRALYYAQVSDGLLIKNEVGHDIVEFEVQTYPTHSNGLTRLLGFGSYYWATPRLKQGAVVRVRWNSFSNTKGTPINLANYFFNSVSFSGDIKASQKTHIFDRQFIIDPNRFMEQGGYNFEITNASGHPLRLAIIYKGLDEKWHEEHWWAVDDQISTALSSGGALISTLESTFYYYAETTDGSNYSWRGDAEKKLIGFSTYGFRKASDTEGTTEFRLH